MTDTSQPSKRNGRQLHTYQQQSVFRAGLHCRVFLYENYLKIRRCVVDVPPLFHTAVHKIFHSSRRNTTDTTWKDLFFQDFDSTTDVENINISLVTDLGSFVFLCRNEEVELEYYKRPSWSAILISEQVVDNVKTLFIPECLHIHHHKGDLYAGESGSMIRRCTNFCTSITEPCRSRTHA